MHATSLLLRAMSLNLADSNQKPSDHAVSCRLCLRGHRERRCTHLVLEPTTMRVPSIGTSDSLKPSLKVLLPRSRRRHCLPCVIARNAPCNVELLPHHCQHGDRDKDKAFRHCDTNDTCAVRRGGTQRPCHRVRLSRGGLMRKLTWHISANIRQLCGLKSTLTCPWLASKLAGTPAGK